MRMKLLFPLCSVLALCTLAENGISASPGQTTPQTLQARDVFDLEWANQPELSPDGRQVVYQRNHYDIMSDRRRSHLWLIDLPSKQHRPLTSGSGTDGAAVWSPTGEAIAWTSARDGGNQIWLRWMDSGQTAVLTQLSEAPGNLAWSADGQQLAFTMRVPASTTALAKLPAKPKGAVWADEARLIDRLGYRADGAGYLEPGYTQVFVLPVEGGTPRQVTRGNFQHRGAPVWSADGKSLYVVSNYAEGWEYQPQESEIYQVELSDGSHKALTDRRGPDNSPALSPDGKQLAYTGYDDRKLGYHISQLYVLDLDSGKSRALTAEFDYAIADPQWDDQGRGIHFSFEREGEGRIGWIASRGGPVQTLDAALDGTAMGRPYGGGSFSTSAGRIAYTHGTAARPAEVAVIERGKAPRVLTRLNADVLDHRTLGAVESFWVKSSADGLNVQSWIVTPPDFDPTRKYPLLLEIHGGPFANYGPRFAPEIQLYAAAGYVVLYVNPRGSTSYGQAFADHIHHNYPSQDYDDLMSAVDAVIARGYVDTERLYVTGGSGGGVLTAWIIGHTERFDAAVVAKPVINWTSFVLTADLYPLFSGYWFPMLPWEPGGLEHYWRRSPLAYVGQVSTPTLLITGEADYRTPISETEQYYQALKLRRVETAMLRIPGAGHGINARPSQMLTQVLNTIAWFERFGSEPPAAP